MTLKQCSWKFRVWLSLGIQGSLSTDSTNCGSCTATAGIDWKNPYLSEPVQFKCMLFQGHLLRISEAIPLSKKMCLFVYYYILSRKRRSLTVTKSTFILITKKMQTVARCMWIVWVLVGFSLHIQLPCFHFVCLVGRRQQEKYWLNPLKHLRISPAGKVSARSPPCQAKANWARRNDSKICRMCFLTSFVESALFLSAALHNRQRVSSIWYQLNNSVITVQWFPSSYIWD